MAGDGGGTDPKRNIRFFGLLVIAFFWVNGGCYGNEALLESASPAAVFLSLIITPIAYSMPLCMMVLELSAALPEDGGMVVWVEVACGHIIGAHNTYWVFFFFERGREFQQKE